MKEFSLKEGGRLERFEVSDNFLLDQKPFKHFIGQSTTFECIQMTKYHSALQLKSLGFNTVETYVFECT